MVSAVSFSVNVRTKKFLEEGYNVSKRKVFDIICSYFEIVKLILIDAEGNIHYKMLRL